MNQILLMVLGHLVSDYTLQGWLADGKQQRWWSKMFSGTTPRKYAHDYLAALACHSLYWSILTFLPLYASPFWAWLVIANAAIHAVVDDLKCNRMKINLWQDQLAHLAQIVATYLIA